MRRKTGNKQKYGGKSIRPCDRKTMKQRDIRKQMSKGNVNFTTIKILFSAKFEKITPLGRLGCARIRNKLEMNN